MAGSRQSVVPRVADPPSSTLTFKCVEQRSKVLLVVSPTGNRIVVYWSTNLQIAGRLHRSFGFVEIEAAVVPFQTASVDHCAARRFLFADDPFVVEVEDLPREDRIPMFHQAFVLAIVMSEVGKVVVMRRRLAEIPKKVADAVVSPVPSHVNDRRLW